MSVLHIGLCNGRHPLKQNDFLFSSNPDIDGTYQPNPTAGEDMDLFVFPAEVDDPLAFDKFRETVYNFIQGEIRTFTVGPEHERCTKAYLYVTGLSSLLTSFLWVWINNDFLWNEVPLVLMHYDRDLEIYKEEYWG